jgi:hypothetical protein
MKGNRASTSNAIKNLVALLLVVAKTPMFTMLIFSPVLEDFKSDHYLCCFYNSDSCLMLLIILGIKKEKIKIPIEKNTLNDTS